MKKILVTGSYGQLGSELQQIALHKKEFEWLFTDADTLDICNKAAIDHYLVQHPVDFIVNCAAYTAVDKAEDNAELCVQINRDAVRNIGESAAEIGAKVIHISTDYVFDGKNCQPYCESDTIHPQSVYGKSKAAGEEALLRVCPDSVIIRTSWLYSAFGTNFVKTMLRLGRERESINVVFDQIGTPTNAADLADCIVQLIEQEAGNGTAFKTGVYHYSNEGVCSWYDFAVTIFRLAGIPCSVVPIESKEFPAKAPRPFYSVLNKTKIKKTFNLQIPHWESSLRKVLSSL